MKHKQRKTSRLNDRTWLLQPWLQWLDPHTLAPATAPKPKLSSAFEPVQGGNTPLTHWRHGQKNTAKLLTHITSRMSEGDVSERKREAQQHSFNCMDGWFWGVCTPYASYFFFYRCKRQWRKSVFYVTVSWREEFWVCNCNQIQVQVVLLWWLWMVARGTCDGPARRHGCFCFAQDHIVDHSVLTAAPATRQNICNLHLEHVRGLWVKHLVVSSCLTHPAGVLQGLSFPSQRLHLCVYKGQHSSTRGLLVLILCVMLHTTAMLCVSVTSYLSRVLFDLL